MSSETTPSFPIGESTRIKLDLRTLLIIVASVAGAVYAYANFRGEVETLKTTTQNHESQLSIIQQSVNKLEMNQNAQTEILKWIARDRRGPVPDALNK